MHIMIHILIHYVYVPIQSVRPVTSTVLCNTCSGHHELVVNYSDRFDYRECVMH